MNLNGLEPAEQIRLMLENLLTNDLFIVGIRIKPTNNIKVYLDADGGLPIDTCTRINRGLYKQIEEKGLYPSGDFSLEVSSPGIDEPLKLVRQYKKNLGRELMVQLTDDRTLTGLLKDVTEEQIVLECTEGKGKKAVIREEILPYELIKKAIVQIKF